jgi:hypothetical protein
MKSDGAREQLSLHSPFGRAGRGAPAAENARASAVRADCRPPRGGGSRAIAAKCRRRATSDARLFC